MLYQLCSTVQCEIGLSWLHQLVHFVINTLILVGDAIKSEAAYGTLEHCSVEFYVAEMDVSLIPCYSLGFYSTSPPINISTPRLHHLSKRKPKIAKHTHAKPRQIGIIDAIATGAHQRQLASGRSHTHAPTQRGEY